jgi:microcompartment protein CcmK/EutM
VYWSRGREATYAFLPLEMPIDSTIVGIVDSINLKRR